MKLLNPIEAASAIGAGRQHLLLANPDVYSENQLAIIRTLGQTTVITRITLEGGNGRSADESAFVLTNLLRPMMRQTLIVPETDEFALVAALRARRVISEQGGRTLHLLVSRLPDEPAAGDIAFAHISSSEHTPDGLYFRRSS